MYELRKTTTKQELLDYLIQEAATPGSLAVNVFSLPSFLDSSLAVNIFLNQLRGYPRVLHWHVRDPEIYDILSTSKIDSHAINYTPPVFNQEVEYKNPSIKEAVEQTLLAGQARTHNTIEIPSNLSYDKIFTHKIENLDPAPQPTPIIENSQEESVTITPEPINIQNAGFQSMIVLHRGEVMDLPQPEKSLPIKASQTESNTLDAWLNNIEKAKESLNNVKKKGYFNSQDPAQSLRNAFEKDAKRHIKRSKGWNWVKTISLAGAAALLTGGIWFGFGSSWFTPDVYTVTVKQDRKEQVVNLTVPQDAAQIEVFETRGESTLSTTGKASTSTKASGLIGLVNDSNQSIALNNAGFYLQKGSTTYSVQTNPAYPGVINIPGGTNGTTFSYTATANIEGATGLAKGERLTVRNLAGSLISDKVYATVLEDIQTPKQGAYVTQADLDNLKQQNADKNTVKVNEKLQSYPEEKITLPSLVKTEVTKESSNVDVNAVADTVTLITDTKNTITFFDSNTLFTALKNQTQASSVDKLNLTSVTQQDSEYKIVARAIYYMQPEFTNDDLSKVLENSSTVDNGTTLLKSRFPTIQNIEKKSGSSFFKKTPEIKIEITN